MGANVPGKPRQLLNYPSVVGYAEICDAVAEPKGNGRAGRCDNEISALEDSPQFARDDCPHALRTAVVGVVIA